MNVSVGESVTGERRVEGRQEAEMLTCLRSWAALMGPV